MPIKEELQELSLCIRKSPEISAMLALQLPTWEYLLSIRFPNEGYSAFLSVFLSLSKDVLGNKHFFPYPSEIIIKSNNFLSS
jgi:hypothetical protein